MSLKSSPLAATVAQASTPSTTQQPVADALRNRARELETQLQEATTHRAELKAYVEAAPPRANMGPSLRHQFNQIEVQINQLDVRILNLQSELRLTNARIAQPNAAPTVGPGTLVPPVTPPPPPAPPGVDVPWMAVMAAVILVPLVLALAWRIVRGGKDVVRRNEWLASEERIQRIEEAVEGIAKDVDRMSEGQRFLTNVLSEAPITVPTREREQVRRDALD